MAQQSRWSVRFSSDAFVLLLLQVLLVVLVWVGLARHISVGEHGEASLLWLYATYVTAMLACGLAIQVADAATGNKVFLVLADYSALTYLFFMCGWFRELIFGLFLVASR